MKSEPIRMDEWVEELQRLSKPTATSDGHFTVTEICERTGWPRQKALSFLRLAKVRGILETRRAMRPRVDGVMSPTSEYRVRLPKTKR